MSSTVKTVFLSVHLLPEALVPTPEAPIVRIPQYITTDHSRPPTPNEADYLSRVVGVTF